MVKLGEAVQDTVSGFKGIVTARAEYLGGNPRCQVQSNISAVAGNMPHSEWIDEDRLAKE